MPSECTALAFGLLRYERNSIIDRSPGLPGTDHAHFAAIVEHSPSFVGLADADGCLTYINATGRALIGLPLDAPLPPAIVDLFMPDDLAFVREIILGEVDRRERWSGDFRFRSLTTDLPVAVDLTVYHLAGTADATPSAVAIVGRDMGERLRSERRLRALVDAGASLTHALDSAQTFDDLARLIVNTLGTLCIIDLFVEGANGARHIERVASAHIDRAHRALHDDVAAFIPDAEHSSHHLARAFRDGSSSLVAKLDETWIARNATSDEHAAMIRALGVRSVMTVPMVAGGHVAGSITCALGTETVKRIGMPDAYDVEDLFFLEELGRRAGGAIETARLYERQHHIAVTLQAASLPQSLPVLTTIELDAEYRPGSAEATIGGDWYDAFALADGRVVLTVGDVLGNGLLAAVTMTKLRQAMQSAAMVNPEPNVMLDVADKTLRMHAPDGYATAIAAIYDPKAASTRFASAGHPGPVLRKPDGTIVEYALPGLLLGMRNGSDSDEVTIPTPSGSFLAFFTDGLTEATRDIAEGNQRLADAIAMSGIINGPNPAAAIVRAVLGDKDAGDDVAMLTMRVR